MRERERESLLNQLATRKMSKTSQLFLRKKNDFLGFSCFQRS